MPHSVSSSEASEDLLHVFDLPQLHAHPSAEDILNALALLAIQAPSWDRSDKLIAPRTQVAPEGVPKYLTSIIASSLAWISSDDQKEEIWEEASLRLAERSGRTAMPAMSRSFRIPRPDGEFEIDIYEPSLTGDKLGFKTWAASYLLSKRLHEILVPRAGDIQHRVLELGSGTGLVGIAAAAALGASVLLTDLPEIEGNLARNVSTNEQVIAEHGGIAKTAILDWTNPTEIISSASSVATNSGTGDSTLVESDIAKFPIIVAADSIYSPEHPGMLVAAIGAWLAKGESSRVIVELPRRSAYTPELKDFREKMLGLGLTMLEEGEESGYDDWGTEEDLKEVECWWSIWGWGITT